MSRIPPLNGRGVPFSLILALVLAVLAGCDDSPTSLDPRAAAGTLGAPAPRQDKVDDLTLARALVGRGGTLDQALKRFEIEDGLRSRIIAALAPHVELRRLSPETGVALARNHAGAPVYLTCRPSMESYVRVEIRGDGTLEARPVEVPVRTTVETAGGIVESTVAEALTLYEDSVRLTQSFADIFQWDVDLFVDPRPGDEIRIVYETRRLGRTPADLPPFGASQTVEGEYLGMGRILAASYEGEQARSIAFWIADDGNGGGYYDTEGDSLAKAFLKSPLNYRRISSRFSRARRNPITRKVTPHHGVDFVADRGTPVVAAADGRVESVGWQGSLGKAVRIRHGRGYTTVYGHLGGFSKGVRSGAKVTQNQVIGYVGSTGRATGPHLHYTLLANGRPVDPLTFDNPPTEPLQASMMPLLEEARRNWSPVLHSIPFEAPRTGLAWVLPEERTSTPRS